MNGSAPEDRAQTISWELLCVVFDAPPRGPAGGGINNFLFTCNIILLNTYMIQYYVLFVNFFFYVFLP